MENTKLKENTLKSKENSLNSSNEEKKYINTWEESESWPFHIVTTDMEDGIEVRVAYGRKIVSPAIFKTKEEAEKYLKEKPYIVLITMAHIIAEEYTKK